MNMVIVYVNVPETRKTWDRKEVRVNVEHSAIYYGVNIFQAFEKFREEFPQFANFEARVR